VVSAVVAPAVPVALVVLVPDVVLELEVILMWCHWQMMQSNKHPLS